MERFQEEFDGKKRAGLLTRGEQYRCQDVSDTLMRYFNTVRGEALREGDEVFERIAGMFGEERKQYEALCGSVLSMLEHAFDFMEGTFGNGQEMVIFITELNTSYDAVRFLNENPCERYYQYNKELLFEDREADILRKLDRLGDISSFTPTWRLLNYYIIISGYLEVKQHGHHRVSYTMKK